MYTINMSKRGIKLNFHTPRGVKKSTTHVRRRGKKKQLLQASTLANAPINPTQPSYMSARIMN